MAKKVDVKKVAKTEVSAKVKLSLEQLGLEVLDGENFGFAEGGLVVRAKDTDVQVKFITPKAGLVRYAEEVAEEAPKAE